MTMSDHIGEFEHLRERIAATLRTNLSRSDTVHLKEHEAMWAADAVLDDLGLEQVGWRLGARLHELDTPTVGDPHQNKMEPVYRLSGDDFGSNEQHDA